MDTADEEKCEKSTFESYFISPISLIADPNFEAFTQDIL